MRFFTETEADRQAWLRDAGLRDTWYLDGSLAQLQAEADRVAKSTIAVPFECPKVDPNWTWQNVATISILFICCAWCFTSLMKAMKP